MPWPKLLLYLFRAAFLGRHRLVLENLALRQQLAAEVHATPVLGGLHHRYRAVAIVAADEYW
jgi:hypothetical protein